MVDSVSENIVTYFANSISQDFLRVMAGRELGDGVGRTVYTCAFRDDLVVKIEHGSGSFQNITEWETWREVGECKKIARWLAPCVSISPSGNVLVMKRTKLPRREDYPDRLPVFLTDTKWSNYGMLDGRLVCHDYGTNRMRTTGATVRTRKVKWWNSADSWKDDADA